MGVKCFDLIIWMNYRSKKEMCLKIGASVLIDDNWNYCHEVLFINLFLFISVEVL